MRIAISGTSCTGKSTFVADFCNKWSMYSPCKFTYREKLQNHSKHTDQQTQWMILNDMIDHLQRHQRTDHVIYDRCPLDNLVYTIWSAEQNDCDVDDAFVEKCVPLVRESMRLLDMIFFVPLTNASPITVVDNGTRETDVNYIAEIDNIFKAIVDQYKHNFETTRFFPRDDSPGIIEIFGNPQQRLFLAEQYLDSNGEIIGDQGSVLNPDNLDQLEQLLRQTKQAADSEKFAQQQTSMLKQFVAKHRGTNRTKPKSRRR